MVFELLLRFSAIGILLFVALLAFLSLFEKAQPSKAQSGSPVAPLLCLVCISLCGPMFLGAPSELNMPPMVELAASFLAAPNVALMWLFGLAVFSDKFRLAPSLVGLAVAITSLSLFQRLGSLGVSGPVPWGGELTAIVTAGVFLHLLILIILEAKNDLIEVRRKARFWAAVLIALGGVGSLLSELSLPSDAKDTFQALVACGFGLVMGVWLLKLDNRRLAFEHEPISEPPAIDDPLYVRLVAHMHEEKRFLDPSLTLADLAIALDESAHELRALINQRAGHRNFPSFVNAFRIEEAKRRLSNADEAKTPVLTIALESGFNSVAPFNRAFREFVGETPTEYRKKIANSPE